MGEGHAASSPLAHSSPSFRTSNTGCPRSSSLQQSHGNKLVSVFVFVEPLSSRGRVSSAPKTPSTLTPVNMRLTNGRTLPFSYSNPCNVTSLHGISIQLEQCQHFQNIPKQHTQHHSFTEFTWIPDALTHFTRSCYTIRKGNCNLKPVLQRKTCLMHTS